MTTCVHFCKRTWNTFRYHTQRLSLSPVMSTSTLPVFSAELTLRLSANTGSRDKALGHTFHLSATWEKGYSCVFSFQYGCPHTCTFAPLSCLLKASQCSCTVFPRPSFASTGHTLDLVLHAKHLNIKALMRVHTPEHKCFHACDFQPF